MFWKKLKKKAAEKHNYDLTYDNVAIPEVHTHKLTGGVEPDRRGALVLREPAGYHPVVGRERRGLKNTP